LDEITLGKLTLPNGFIIVKIPVAEVTVLQSSRSGQADATA